MNAKNLVIKLFLILLFNTYNSSISFSKDTIKIGTLLPYSGVYTVLGEEITNAMSLPRMSAYYNSPLSVILDLRANQIG